MPESVLEKANAQVAQSIHKVSRSTAAFADAVEGGMDVAKRIGKHGSDVVEELMDDTTQRIKRHPAETVVAAFAVGFIVGGFVDWLTRRR